MVRYGLPMLMTPKNTTPAEAAKQIAWCVEMGAVTFVAHALDAMRDENVSEFDVEDVLVSGSVVADKNHADRWTVVGAFTVVVEIEIDPWTTVVTVF